MLKSLMNYLKQEPVRVHLYAVVGLVLAGLVAKGVISDSDLPYILGVVAAVLGVENLRSKVTPAGKSPPSEPAETSDDA